MESRTNIYGMSPTELNKKYQEAILKHVEAEEAYRLIRTYYGSKKEKLNNWLAFEKSNPPSPDEKEKVALLNLVKELLKPKPEAKEEIESTESPDAKSNDKDAERSNFTRMTNAFKSAYPDYEHGHLPNTPAKMAYERFKRSFPDYLDAKQIEECDMVVLNSPDGAEYCFHVANLRNQSWPDAERKIAESPWWSYMYAKMVLKGRFNDGEATIATSGQYSYMYANFVIKGRFVQGEQAISMDPRASLSYAQKVVRGRFELGETAIFQTENTAEKQTSMRNLADEYRKFCLKTDASISWHSNNTEVGGES